MLRKRSACSMAMSAAKITASAASMSDWLSSFSMPIAGSKRNCALGDADHAHAERGDAGIALLLAPVPAVEERGQAQAERGRADGGGARAHDGEVALLDHGGAEKERGLVDRAAHV